jgi:malate synthase
MDEKTVEQLHKQVREAYNRAYLDRIKKAITEGEHEYISSLIQEIRDRIKGLVPNRSDMHRGLDSHIDMVLIKQMLENNAFGAEDFYNVINTFLQYIEDLQAPVDKPELDAVRAKLNSLDGTLSWADAVSPFFLDINRMIDLIEKRRKDALQDPIILAMLKRSVELRARK